MNDWIFDFKHYEVNGTEVKFYYAYRDGDKTVASFCERYILPSPIDPNQPVTKRILQMLHLLVGISYYKSLFGDVSHPYQLNDNDVSYLNAVYDRGLGELAYLNKVTDTIQPFVSNTDDTHDPVGLDGHGGLLGIGGGKDSIVAGELLREINIPTATMDMATRDNHGQAGAVMQVMGFEQFPIERYLDTSIVEFTDKHHGHHGHIPFSAILAWFGVLIAHATKKRYVLMANESSTSTGNTTWNGQVINHQWAKSYEFEKITQNYIHATLSPDIWYFSPIRPYSSLAVMALFAHWGEKYYPTFTSCNFVLRIDPNKRPNNRWCGVCPKCLSTWLLLSAWLDRKQLENIFSKNLFEDESLKPTLLELLDLKGHKPLNCVGTSEELRAVTRKALKNYPESVLLAGISSKDIPGPTIKALISQLSPHNIPTELEKPILERVASLLE